ncbi:DUF5805 domain-containing protein [Haloarcula pelagica]|uniref:DUF5805 domain-containing protein n=1 Tax=Haloarcula pelagica TaxID=3033389 RepID=UPI0024C255ED|nr:DUF5805 domain-containing protein [Halomicroarcula sp. YJ-61-S]
MADEGGGERAAVRTYVPEYQKQHWQDHADELGMSQSEFVRTMVQAGRTGFEPADHAASDNDSTAPREQPGSPDATPGVKGVKNRLQEVLDDGDFHDWDDLLTELTDSIEDQLEDALQELQAEGVVTYSGRHGGYVIDE